RAVRLCAILDHFEVALAGEFHDGIHFARPAREMHRNDRPRSGSQHRADGLGGEVLARGIDFGTHRCAAAHDGATRARNEGAARDDDLVPGADAERVQSELQRRRAVRKRNGVAAPGMLGIIPFEGPGLVPGPVIHFSGGEHLRAPGAICTPSPITQSWSIVAAVFTITFSPTTASEFTTAPAITTVPAPSTAPRPIRAPG